MKTRTKAIGRPGKIGPAASRFLYSALGEKPTGHRFHAANRKATNSVLVAAMR